LVAVPYLALRFDVAGDDVERWSDALLDAGALAVDAADANAGGCDETSLFGEPGAPATTWPLTRLTALFDAGDDAPAALALAGAQLATNVPAHTVEPVADDDWVRRTQEQFAPIQASRRIWIVPTWCEPSDAAACNLRIDPGLAFGTGSHATTRLCLRWLDAGLARGASVLDYGCGSGILAIAAARLGAGEVCAVDVDPNALQSCIANAACNAVDVHCGMPDSLRVGGFDIVVANILANALQMLAPVLAARVNRGGDIALSGILDAQADALKAEYARWFNIDVWAREDGWVLLAGRRKRDDG
jgi:ribosomal protein L11 methyltransferase